MNRRDRGATWTRTDQRVAHLWRWWLGEAWSGDGFRRGPDLSKHLWPFRLWCWWSGSHTPWRGGGGEYCLTCASTRPRAHPSPVHAMGHHLHRIARAGRPGNA